MLKLVSVVALLCLSACSDSAPPTSVEPCGSVQPTFRLVLKDSAGALPSDVSFRVMHGAGCEAYALASGGVAPCSATDKAGVLFCTARVAAGEPSHPSGSGGGAGASGVVGVAGNAGAAGGLSGTKAVESLECEVYSDGAITVAVWRSGSKWLERELSAERDARCGVVTVSATIDLQEQASR